MAQGAKGDAWQPPNMHSKHQAILNGTHLSTRRSGVLLLLLLPPHLVDQKPLPAQEPGLCQSAGTPTRMPIRPPRTGMMDGLTVAPGFQQIFDADLKEARVLLAGHVLLLRCGCLDMEEM